MQTGTEPATDRPEWARKATLLLLSTLTIMSGTVISASLPGIVHHFRTVGDVAFLAQLIMTVPALSIVVGAPVAGTLADRLGRRRLLLVAVLVYGLAGAAGLWLETLQSILVSRVILGFAVAGIMVNTTALAGDYFEGHARTRFMGHRSVAISAGGIVFLVFGGLLAGWNWRAPFAIYLVAFVFLPMTLLWLPEPEAAGPERFAGTPSHGILEEHRRHLPLYLIGMVHFIAFYHVFTYMPFRLQEFSGTSGAWLGVVLGTVTGSSALASAIFPRIAKYLIGNRVFTLAFCFVGAGYVAAAVAGDLPSVLAAMVLVGAGTGLLLPNLTASAVSRAAPLMRGRVAGVMSASVFLGQFLSPICTHPLIISFGGQQTFALLALVYFALAGLMFLRSASVEP